jgi:PST family polysaccharide transporter
MIFMLFAQGVGELGLSAALVQQTQISELKLSTAFWSNMSVSLILAAFTYGSADIITGFIGDASAAPLLRVLCLVFPIMACAVVPRAMLTRALEFRPLSVQQLVSEATFAVVGVGMALAGMGFWSLAGAVLGHRLMGSAVLVWFVRWRPRLIFSTEDLRQLIGFGGPFMAGAILQRGVSNLDYFLVGRFLGTEALGYYSLAFQVGAVPLERLVSVLSRVAFPALSSLKTEPRRMRQAYLAGLRHLLTLMIPVGLFIAVLSPWVAEAAYGDKWLPAVTALQILAVGGIFYSFDVAYALFFAAGKPRFRILVTLTRLGIFAAGILLFWQDLTIEKIALSLGIALVITGGLSWRWAARLLSVSSRDGWSTLWPSVRASLFALIPVASLPFVQTDGWSPLVVAMCLLLSMSLLYLAGLFKSYRETLKTLLASSAERRSTN